eukprot:scaffold2033_cov367-Prasinococcus_capsulatus_cf.AAC.2
MHRPTSGKRILTKARLSCRIRAASTNCSAPSGHLTRPRRSPMAQAETRNKARHSGYGNQANRAYPAGYDGRQLHHSHYDRG